jgi:hypothetical protein
LSTVSQAVLQRIYGNVSLLYEIKSDTRHETGGDCVIGSM